MLMRQSICQKSCVYLSHLSSEMWRSSCQFWRSYDPNNRHAVSRDVFHGQKGELRQRYREDQEDQLGALGLVVNILLLWNTLYMQDALDDVRTGGQEVRQEDVERLSPLTLQHINLQGDHITTYRVFRKVDDSRMRSCKRAFGVFCRILCFR